jgi:protein-S-isoprenylcysteine O-methyltransferase Ste14
MASSGKQDRPNAIHWPPILYVLTLLVAVWLDWTWRIPVLLQPPLNRLIGWPVVLLGAGVGLAGILHFRTAGTSFDPTAPADALATGGIYQYTRNPMYLGAVIAFVGLGLSLYWTWLIILTPLMAIALRYFAIGPEEAYLERRFDRAYVDYKAKVRRWI